ncbi:hypothetical protein KEM60_02882 [Austwickia sp. TVS 96-490-7B]|uniref:GntR family transcriptional regulator n=1 Tax=Austwickia sp. TVS 96-490-7B TaxID=2830843 RepID=UPI001C582586|nr:GntR family transcriptional regulator [Austwickia sp. TVS 96-490-7B]MBW3086653.1 hypothetical protein [Austwickia sp. TVS 96-490-7B]
MIIALDPASTVAPYAQIRDQVVDGITAGTLAVGAKLPTVRQLAGDLGLAVNTVAKAYKQLEAEGHVATRGRLGTVVLARRHDPTAAADPRPAPGEETHAAAILLARAAQRHGLDLDQAIGLLRQIW